MLPNEHRRCRGCDRAFYGATLRCANCSARGMHQWHAYCARHNAMVNSPRYVEPARKAAAR